jgi:hypothetical protein
MVLDTVILPESGNWLADAWAKDAGEVTAESPTVAIPEDGIVAPGEALDAPGA